LNPFLCKKVFDPKNPLLLCKSSTNIQKEYNTGGGNLRT
jgi:hypothetical protein